MGFLPILGMIFSAANIGIGIANSFRNRKAAEKAEKEAKKIAAANKAFGYEQADLVREQRLDEAGIFLNQAERSISAGTARRGASGVGFSGSSLLMEITSQINAQKDFRELQRQASQASQDIRRRADLGYEQTAAEIAAASDASKATLIGNIGSAVGSVGNLINYSIQSGLFTPGGQDDHLKAGYYKYTYDSPYRKPADRPGTWNPYQ